MAEPQENRNPSTKKVLIAYFAALCAMASYIIGTVKYEDYQQKQVRIIQRKKDEQNARIGNLRNETARTLEKKLVEKNIPKEAARNLSWDGAIHKLNAEELEAIFKHCKKFELNHSELMRSFRTITPKYLETYDEKDLKEISRTADLIIKRRIPTSSKVWHVAVVHQAHTSPFKETLKGVHKKVYEKMLEGYRRRK